MILFCLKNASKKESRESLAKVSLWNFRWPDESFMKLSVARWKFHETFVWRAKVSWNFRMASESFTESFAETFGWPPKVSVKLSPNFLSHDSFFDAFVRPKNHVFQLFSHKNEKFHLGFYQKKRFSLDFSSKNIFSLICPNDVFFFTETFSQKLTNLSEISHVIPRCVSLFASKGSHFHLWGLNNCLR